MVVAILAKEQAPDLRVALVESDRRKATFLSDVVRRLDLSAQVHAVRLEVLPAMEASVISARAFAPLDKLLGQMLPHLAPGGMGLFLKGQSYREELQAAEAHWAFDCDEVESRTDPRAVVLKIRNIRHV